MTVRRFTPEGSDRKTPLPLDGLASALPELLQKIQDELFQAAVDRREAGTVRGVQNYAEYSRFMEEEGGFAFTGWCGSAGCEQRVKDDTKSTIRVIPDEEFRSSVSPDRCLCGEPSVCEVLRARAY